MNQQEFTQEEKMKAAYALNLVSVSVSQIVEYNDTYILEQEYDNILNNLNLEQMPKDDALLNILIQLLNTLSFFRIQNLKQEQIEKKYQYRMKNAIWSAIPNFGVILTAGHPFAIAASLATQIGVGYMNYRKEKFQISLDREEAEMELRYTVIEQLNTLKRELFTTAWRLAEKYDFADHYRLTERQITQYNKILMDPDELRKYDRLEAVQKNFVAYLPFWYFFGHTASFIANTTDDYNVRRKYLELAKQHFSHYEMLNKFNILREDSLTASWALEFVDLLMLESAPDQKRIANLIHASEEKSGDRNDILQLCVIAYLRIGQIDDAKRLLKILVNEEYNTVINAQLLSGLYVRDNDKASYRILCERVPQQYLYPMPSDDRASNTQLNHEFEHQQRIILKYKFKDLFHGIIDKYTAQINKKYATFDFSEEYADDYYANTPRSIKRRRLAAGETFSSDEKSSIYIARIQGYNLPCEYTNILEDIFSKVFEISCFGDLALQSQAIYKAKIAISQYSERVNSIQSTVDQGTFSMKQFDQMQHLGIQSFVKSAFEYLFKYVCAEIDRIEVNNLFAVETQLLSMCEKFDISMPEIQIQNDGFNDDSFGTPGGIFDVSMFGENAVLAKKEIDSFNLMADFLRKRMSNVDASRDVRIIYRGDKGFSEYFLNQIFEKYQTLYPHSLMIIQDLSKQEFDLIFTTEGIVSVVKNKVRRKTPYRDCRVTRNTLELIGKSYTNSSISVTSLLDIARSFDARFISIKGQAEYVGGIVTAAKLNEWFKNNHNAMNVGVNRYYAWPIMELLNNMGYFIEQDLDKDFYLLQFYCKEDTGVILGFRVVEFDQLDPSFRNKLDECNGVIKVEGR